MSISLRLFFRVVLALALFVVGAGNTPAILAAASTSTHLPCTICQPGSDPYATGCADLALLIESAPLMDSAKHHEMGVVMLWQSLTCKTVWAAAMSDDYCCHIEAALFEWDGKKLGASTDPGGSAPLPMKGNLEFAYTPQFTRDMLIFGSGNGKLCTEAPFSGYVYEKG